MTRDELERIVTQLMTTTDDTALSLDGKAVAVYGLSLLAMAATDLRRVVDGLKEIAARVEALIPAVEAMNGQRH